MRAGCPRVDRHRRAARESCTNRGQAGTRPSSSALTANARKSIEDRGRFAQASGTAAHPTASACATFSTAILDNSERADVLVCDGRNWASSQVTEPWHTEPMTGLRYAREKLGLASLEISRSSSDVRGKLLKASQHLYAVSESDFPEPLLARFRSVQLTMKKRGRRDGVDAWTATISAMTDAEALNVAGELVELSAAIDGLERTS